MEPEVNIFIKNTAASLTIYNLHLKKYNLLMK